MWRRERLEHDGRYYQIPLPAGQGTGLGKPLKLINHPVRDRIPIVVAALGPKNVEMAAELAEGWEPIFYFPEKAADAWGEPLAAGAAKRDPSLPPLDIIAQAGLAIGEGPETTALRDLSRPMLALYIGGMGARGRNFYNDLAVRFGYAPEAAAIQDAYLDGRKDEAAAPGAGLAAGGHVPDRPPLPGRRADRRDARGGRHHAQRRPAGRDPRRPRGPDRADPRPGRLTGLTSRPGRPG